MTQKRDTENVESRLPEEEDPEVQRWMELLRTDVPPEVEARLNAALDRFVAQLPDQPTRRSPWMFIPRLNWVNVFAASVNKNGHHRATLTERKEERNQS